ncbi:hypothetical protein OUZ56_032403 [Daphnia magna]|uniref:Uncharacterized protein n=1 Tax=Daphnia magna TaxID=35525 RepID=A0ABR0B8T6_9CRUS|nr:hypothetical protein OUZ56_032403 [Daphnia magna]
MRFEDCRIAQVGAEGEHARMGEGVPAVEAERPSEVDTVAGKNNKYSTEAPPAGGVRGETEGYEHISEGKCPEGDAEEAAGAKDTRIENPSDSKMMAAKVDAVRDEVGGVGEEGEPEEEEARLDGAAWERAAHEGGNHGQSKRRKYWNPRQKRFHTRNPRRGDPLTQIRSAIAKTQRALPAASGRRGRWCWRRRREGRLAGPEVGSRGEGASFIATTLGFAVTLRGDRRVEASSAVGERSPSAYRRQAQKAEPPNFGS